MVFVPDGAVGRVYFPETAVISLVTVRDGRTVAVGTVGSEGMVGLSVFLEESAAFAHASSSIGGLVSHMAAADFKRLAAKPGPLHGPMLRYIRAFLTQISQSASCSGAHLVEQRCARWILATRDRANAHQFPLSLDFLSFMVGVQSGGVTLGLRTLEDKMLIRHRHGHLEILDESGLENASCDCYSTARAQHAKLLGLA